MDLVARVILTTQIGFFISFFFFFLYLFFLHRGEGGGCLSFYEKYERLRSNIYVFPAYTFSLIGNQRDFMHEWCKLRSSKEGKKKWMWRRKGTHWYSILCLVIVLLHINSTKLFCCLCHSVKLHLGIGALINGQIGILRHLISILSLIWFY